jgi:DNA-binding MarR family transcriptional regulator
MGINSEALLHAIFSLVARQTFPIEQLREIVMKGSGDKQLRAFNMCDGTKGQSEIAKSLKLDTGNFSRTVARWIEAGVLFRLGEGREAKLLHVYPLPDGGAASKERKR